MMKDTSTDTAATHVLLPTNHIYRTYCTCCISNFCATDRLLIDPSGAGRCMQRLAFFEPTIVIDGRPIPHKASSNLNLNFPRDAARPAFLRI